MRKTCFKNFWLLVGLLLLTSTAWAQTPEKPASTPDNGAIPTTPEAIAPNGVAPAKKDCHGPLYYKMKNEAEKQRAAEEDRKEATALMEKWGEFLWKVENKRIPEEKKAQFRRYERCLKRKGHPSLLCTALGKHDSSLCRGVIREAEKHTCNLILGVDGALRKKDISVCDELATGDMRSVCRFVISGEFHCETLSDSPIRVPCETMKVAFDTGTIPTSMDHEASSAAAWMMALLKDDDSFCKRIPTGKEAEACKALVNNTTEVCEKVRPLVEPIDNDYSCRNIVLDVRTHKLGDRTEVIALLGSTYKGNGTCIIKLHLKNNGKPMVRVVETLNMEIGKHFKRRFVLEKEEFVSIRGDCTWDPETSMYYLEEPVESVDRW